MKKRKKLFLIAAILIGIYFGPHIVDRIWFTFRIPSDFAEARWQGNWKSDRFAFVSGLLLVNLPDPVPQNKKFDVDALVYYRLWSPYRTGKVVHIKMAGYLNSGQSGGGGNAESPITLQPHYIFKFKGGDGSTVQTIDYIATSDANVTTIVGGYRSDGPSDIGHFVIEKR